MNQAWEVYCKTMRDLGGGDGPCYALIMGGPEHLEYIPILDLQPNGRMILNMNTDAWCSELPDNACAYEVTLREKNT